MTRSMWQVQPSVKRWLLSAHTTENHFFYVGGLTKDSVVVDLGANKGRFAADLRREFDCEVHSVEAHPELFAALPTDEKLHTYHLAICGEDGPVQFNLSSQVDASSLVAVPQGTEERTLAVEGHTIESFLGIAGIDQVDLLKVDIEGAEIAAFDAASDRTLLRCRQITVEFHDFCGLVSTGDIERVVARLSDLGFQALRVSREDYSDTLFIHRSAISQLSGWYLDKVSRRLWWHL